MLVEFSFVILLFIDDAQQVRTGQVQHAAVMVQHALLVTDTTLTASLL
jgi:hypothetical protein